MKRNLVLVAMLCLFAVTFAWVTAAQDIPKIIGTWYITIHNFGNSTTTVPHQARWMLQQDGTKIRGIGKNTNGELALVGTLTGKTLNVEATGVINAETKPVASDRHNQVQATLVQADSLDGMIRFNGGKDGEFVWQARRYPNVRGRWYIMSTTVGPQPLAQWFVSQDGTKVTGHIKEDSIGQVPLAGTVTGNVLHLEGTGNERRYQIDATMDVLTDSMDGTLRINGKEYILAARRPKQ